MRVRTARAVVALLAMVLPGCGGPGWEPRPCVEGSGEEACLLVVQEVVPRSILAYPEGFVSYVRIEGEGITVDAELHGRSLKEPREYSVLLPAGRYRIVSYQRQCPPPGCNDHDPEPRIRDRCETGVVLAPGERRVASLIVHLGQGCDIIHYE